MEKLMMLKAISEKKSREITRQDGSKKNIYWHEVILTDGLDTMICETSESVTEKICSEDPNVKLEMNVGTLYNCRITANVISYEKNGQKSYFNKLSLSVIVPV